MPRTKSNKLSAAKVRFIEPMYARLVQKLPEGDDWLYEVKFDGYRCLAARDSSGVTLWSRRGRLERSGSRFSGISRKRKEVNTELDGYKSVTVEERRTASVRAPSNSSGFQAIGAELSPGKVRCLG